MLPLKPALTYAQQIDRLRNVHELTVDDDIKAIEILSRVNYYRLSAYGIGLKRPDNLEKYVSGITLTDLYNLHTFDGHLRNSLLHLVEQVEIELRSQISYLLGTKYGPEGYRDVSNFADYTDRFGNSIHAGVLEKLDAEIKKQSNLPCVIHHQQRYGGHFPVWAAVELFTFGMLSSMYSVMKREDQTAIASFYRVSHRHLRSWILALVELRNRCAHYGRIYNMPFSQTPYLFSEHSAYQSNKLFPVLLVLRRMTHHRSVWKTFYSSLVGLIESNPAVRVDFMAFPDIWQDLLE